MDARRSGLIRLWPHQAVNPGSCVSPLLWCGFRGAARPPYHSQTNSCGKARSLRDRLWTCRGGRLPPAAWRTNLCPCVDIGSGPVGSSGAGRQGDRRFDSGTSVVRTPHPSREWVARALLEIDQHGPLTELAIAVGPRVRISFAPAESLMRTAAMVIKASWECRSRAGDSIGTVSGRDAAVRCDDLAVEEDWTSLRGG